MSADITPAAARQYHGTRGTWEAVIGLEVHAQVASNAKLFSTASTAFGAEPNTHVDLVDAAMPGMLPVLNAFCVEQTVRTGLGLKARINLVSQFDRKNYFYPDLPQGYQISQLYHPIIGAGEVDVEIEPGVGRTIRIDHIHLEQDAGKSLHDVHPGMSMVDLNRTGVALMEIVTCPDIRSPEEAAATILKLRQIMRYLGTCDGNMQDGNLRADVNVSVRPAGASDLGTRCEIKNMNSTRFIQQAISFEVERQIGVIEDGGTVEQETRLYDPDRGTTRSMRSKEEAHDYRYFPCPDLLPLELDPAWVDTVAATLPELPDARKARLVADYGITPYDAAILTAERDSADFFEAVARGRQGKLAANWVINELFGRLNRESLDLGDSPVNAGQLGELLDLVSEGLISGAIAKDVFDHLWTDGGSPREVVESNNLAQVTEASTIEAIVDRVFADNPDQVAKARVNPRVAGFLVGQTMKASAGKANPRMVNEIIRQRLGT